MYVICLNLVMKIPWKLKKADDISNTLYLNHKE